MTLTPTMVASWLPCQEYPPERIDALFRGRDCLTLGALLDLGLPPDDLLWVLLREVWMDVTVLDRLAQGYLMHTAMVVGPDSNAPVDAMDSYLLAYKARYGVFDSIPDTEQTGRWIEGASDWERRVGLCALWCAVTEARAAGGDQQARAAAWDAARHWQVSRAVITIEGVGNAEP